MKIRYATNPNDAKYYTTEEIRTHYLIDDLFENDLVKQTKIESLDIVGIMPRKKVLTFQSNKGILIVNTSGIGTIKINENEYTLDLFQAMIVKPNEKIEFKSIDDGIATRFLVTTVNYQEETKAIDLAEGYENDFFKTGLKTVNNKLMEPMIYNAMQIYLYSDLNDEMVCHIFGRPEETRHIFMKESEVIISPSWSIAGSYGPNEYKMFYFIIKEENTNIDIDELL